MARARGRRPGTFLAAAHESPGCLHFFQPCTSAKGTLMHVIQKLGASLSLASVCVAATAAGNLVIDPLASSVNPGNAFSLKVLGTAFSDVVVGGGFNLSFNSTLLRLDTRDGCGYAEFFCVVPVCQQCGRSHHSHLRLRPSGCRARACYRRHDVAWPRPVGVGTCTPLLRIDAMRPVACCRASKTHLLRGSRSPATHCMKLQSNAFASAPPGELRLQK